jgi:hypothetical protein
MSDVFGRGWLCSFGIITMKLGQMKGMLQECNKASLSSFSKLQTLKSTQAMADAMKGVTKVGPTAAITSLQRKERQANLEDSLFVPDWRCANVCLE